MEKTSVKLNKASKLVGRGRLEDAEVILKRLLKSNGQTPRAWRLLGAVHFNQRHFAEAERCYRRLLELEPHSGQAARDLGTALSSQDKLQDALTAYAQAADLIPEDADTFRYMGRTLARLGHYAEAVSCHRRSLQLAPKNLSIYIDMSTTLIEARQFDEVIVILDKAIKLAPDSALTYINVAAAYRGRGDLDKAERAYLKAIEKDPTRPESYSNLGNLLVEQGRDLEALTLLKEAARRNPERPEVHQNLGAFFVSRGRILEAKQAFESALSARPRYAPAEKSLADLKASEGDFDEAIQLFKSLIERNPSDANSIAGLVSVYDLQGRHGEAYELIAPFLRKEPPDTQAVIKYLGFCKHLKRCDEAIRLAEGLLTKGEGLSRAEKTALHFASGRALDAKKDFDAAFPHFEAGNDLKGIRQHRNQFISFVDRLVETFSAHFFEDHPNSGNRANLPVFIVGMPRSGTTLVEQIISAHPAAYGAGELPHIVRLVRSLPSFLRDNREPYPECVSKLNEKAAFSVAERYLEKLRLSPGEPERVTDKMPHNFLHLGLIALLFPNARIIHCTRNPVDTCLSCYFQDFMGRHTYAYDLDDLGFYYGEYRRLMAHWHEVLPVQIIDVNYEELTANPEEVSRRIIDHVGLPWDDRCMEFYKTGRNVATASYDQVRQPIYRKSVERWRNYEQHIQPLLSSLKQAGVKF